MLTGNSAANLLSGGAGVDTLLGGAGDDTYVVDQAGDVVTEQANAGIDRVESSVDYTLGANIENLTLTGEGDFNGTGNSLSNVLTDMSGWSNVLTGGAGDDTYVVGTNDTVVEAAKYKPHFSVLPGIINPCHLEKCSSNSLFNIDQIDYFELEYLSNWSLWEDIKILSKTIFNGY